MAATRRHRLLVVSLVAVAITVLWCGVISPPPAFPHFFQFEFGTSTRTDTRVYYSRGAGFRESESANAVVEGGEPFTIVRLPLPPGKYRAIRFAPSDHAGSFWIRDPRITTFDGRTVRRFSAGDFSVNADVAKLKESAGIIQLRTTADGTRPELFFEFDPVLPLAFGFWSKVWLICPRWLWTFGLTFAGILVAQAVIRQRFRCPAGIAAFCQQRPRTALALCAALAAVTSSYPVVCFGKSFMSPTNGALLLYDHAPTLPGFTDLRPDNAYGADVGAMMWQHLPYTVRQHHALRDGALPLWNRYDSVGAILFGQGQSMFGDPLHFLEIAAGGQAWAFDLKFVLVRALFAFGVGLCVWSLTRDFTAAAIACVASAFIAFFNYRGNHPAIFSLGYSPWVLVGWLQLIGASDRRAFRRALLLWFAANWCLLTSGTVKEAYMLGLSLNGTGVLMFLFAPSPAGNKLRRAGIIAVACVALLLVASPILWTFFQSLAASYTNYEIPTVFQIQRGWFVGLFDDLFYREFIPGNQVYQPAANFLILLGCFCAVLQPRRLLASRGALALLVTALIALSLAFEIVPAAWLLPWPLVRNVHHFHNIFSGVAIVHLCILAGWGYSAARQPLRAGHGGRLALPMVVLLALMFVAYFTVVPPLWTNGPAWHGWSGPTMYQWAVYAHVILLPLAMLVLLYAASRRLRGEILTGAIVVPALLASMVILGRHGLHLPFFEPNAFLVTPGSRPDLFRPSPAVEFLQREIKAEPGRIIGTGNNLFPGFATVYDFEGINGPDALVNRHYREFADASGLAQPGDWRFEMSPADLPQWRPILDFLNVRNIAAPPGVLTAPSGYRRIARLDFEVYRSEHSWPRAFFTDHVEPYDHVAQLVQLIRERSPATPFAAVQTGDAPDRLPGGKPAGPEGEGLNGHGDKATHNPIVAPASDYVLEPNRTSFTVTAPGPGVAVLQEAWLADDFRATLNGQPIPYFRVNHMFKGVVIPAAGTYRVSFAYWPRGFTLTLVLAVVGITGFILLVLAVGRGPERVATER